MSDNKRLLLAIIARNQHTGVTQTDLFFAMPDQKFNINIKQFIFDELSLDHITEIKSPDGVSRYKINIRDDFRDVTLNTIDKNIFMLHHHLQNTPNGLKPGEIASKLQISEQEANKIVEEQLGKEFIKSISQTHLNIYASALSIDVGNLVIREDHSIAKPQRWPYVVGFGSLGTILYYVLTALF
ncbi:MAG: hypothetical protein CMK59_13350 [Proteobacteria bacterium]|nr:hypothetical protein [Pseudomonadota bacterium]